MGSVLQANLGQAPARQAAKFAGLPDSVNCSTINKVCASGMKVDFASRSKYIVGRYRGGGCRRNGKYEQCSILCGTICDGEINTGTRCSSTDLPKTDLPMYTTERPWGMQPNFVLLPVASAARPRMILQLKVISAPRKPGNQGSFKDEVVAVEMQKKGETMLIERDEEPFNVKFEKIPTLKPAFQKDGTVTAANASSMNDGAAALDFSE